MERSGGRVAPRVPRGRRPHDQGEDPDGRHEDPFWQDDPHIRRPRFVMQVTDPMEEI
jgi:hypothetical protein